MKSEASLVSVQAAQGVNKMLVDEITRTNKKCGELEDRLLITENQLKNVRREHEVCEERLRRLEQHSNLN